MKLRKQHIGPRIVEIYATDLEALNQAIRNLNSLHGSQTVHVSREITALENTVARMNLAPTPDARVEIPTRQLVTA